ncbi:hypothetical protein FDB55_12980 [Clostridium botulinum]|nr:hypothetical protein [Clostridium botulinum]NFN14901.1 hypothetical protein [Clostridium botulinum]NFN22647.1 hypothetical protein [Clostridium botulinum]NFN43321.1 hypothetical protein [Clostridium botulinum]
MFKVENFEMTHDEWREAMNKLKNTYYPIHDSNGKIVDMVNVPSAETLIETVIEIRRKKAL